MQVITHQHASGEVFEADNLEVARGMCPVLGKMSLEEAGLLLELEAMGKAELAEQQDASQEKPPIEKIEKVQPKPDEIKKPFTAVAAVVVSEATLEAVLSASDITEPTFQATADERVANKPAAPDLQAVLMAHAEAARIAEDTPRDSEVVETARFEEAVPSKELPPAIKVAEVSSPADAADVEAVILHEAVHEVETQAPLTASTSEHVTLQQNESPAEQVLDDSVPPKHETVEVEAILTDIDLPLVDETMAEPPLTAAIDESAGADIPELLKVEISMADDQPVDDNLSELEKAAPVINLEQTIVEHADDQEIPSHSAADVQFVKYEPAAFTGAEASPLLAVPELPATIVEVEATMEQLVDAIEVRDAEEPGKIEAILEDIIAMPAKVELATGDDAKELDEKLEELFVELFEEANISYSPELVESFVKLTRMHYFEELLVITKDAEEASQGLPDEIGTREFLQKLQHGLGAMKQAVINFYELGKSILRLYSFNVETAASTLG
jgi:hypothetical protein